MTTASPEDIKHVCEECQKKTDFTLKYEGGLFRPVFRGLRPGQSAIINSPLAIFAEWLYKQWLRLGNFFKAVNNWLFPRRNKIYGTTMDSWVVGNITFAKKQDELVPIHHLRLELWSRTWLGQWRKLSEGYSAEDGSFRLPFELHMARLLRVRTIHFEIYQITEVMITEQIARPVHQLFKCIRIPKGDLIGMEYNLRNIQLFFWEYRTDTALPRAVIKDRQKDAPQYYSQGRLEAIVDQVIPIELIKEKHKLQIKLRPDTITLAEIQADYRENLTVCIEKKLPGYTRGDDWFAERVMNGMNRACFVPDADNPNHYWANYFGKGYYDGNHEYALPDCAMKFALKPNGLPQPLEINTTGPLNAFNRDWWQQHKFTPADGEKWLQAKRVVRVNGGFSAEVDEHFASTHVNTEQYAMTVYRNLRLSPLAMLLYPHVKEVVLINHSADSILLNGYIPQASALSYEGLLARCKDTMGMLDWKGFTCTKPISDAHNSAKAENLFWRITHDYVSWFIHNHLDGIKKYWYEVYCCSEDLLNHAVPVFLSDVDLDALDPRDRERRLAMKAYFKHQYAFDETLDRPVRNGITPAVSAITLHQHFPDDQAEEAISDLIQLCTYIIFIASYMHTWANERQYDDIGEVLYCSLGLRFGEKESGILAPESDLSIAPDLTRSTEMMYFSNLLSRTGYGYITANEDGDINPYFSNLLLSKKEEFAALGVKAEAIESRTNI